LGLHPAAGQPGEQRRIPLSGDQRLDHGAAGHAHDVGGHRRYLDQGVFEQFLQPLHLPGTVVGEICPQPGVVAQSPDRCRRHETRPQQALLGQLGKPNRVQLVFSELNRS
jgi:hypothetical protein